MLEKVSGEVTYILRDKNTEEIISQHTQKNIITESFYSKLNNTYQLGFNIVVTNALVEQSRYTWIMPANGTAGISTTFPNRIIPSVGVYSKYVAADGITPQYVQFSGRYDAPAIGTTRTINAVSLNTVVDSVYSSPTTSPETNSSRLNGSPWASSMAFLRLTTPCIQTDLQVLDVYYRLFFPYDSATGNIPEFIYEIFVNEWTTNGSGWSSAGSTTFPFRLPKPKAGDENLTMISPRNRFSWQGPGNYNVGFGRGLSSTFGNLFVNTTDANFTDNRGVIINSQINWSHNGNMTYYQNLPKVQKIQNLIGIGQETTDPLTPPFLDVDNLPTGTGKLFLSGNWNNIGTPSSAGLYYSSKLPEYNRIKIISNGNVGSATYKIVRQKFFGYLSRYNSFISSNYYYTARAIPALSAFGISSNGTTTRYDYNKTLLEDITETYFSVQQLSSCCRFDDSSMIFVKKNKIILYSIAAGDYWKINGSYTNIHQVAVMNNKIYIACRDTGLWVVDPYNSLTPVSLASPGSGIDLSVCHGVAKGNGNIVWAVGANCLASYNGTTWTKYDATTTPAFNMTGVSDNNWSNIEYIKVDEDSVDNQMLLVRKYNATVDSTLLGVWWSTVGTATNTGAETAASGNNYGRPRVHRGHVGGLGGYWLVLVQNQWNRMSFGTTTFTSVSNVAIYQTPINSGPGSQPKLVSNIFQSAVFIKNNSAEVRSWHADSAVTVGTTNSGTTYNSFYGIGQETITASGTISETITASTSGLLFNSYEIFYVNGSTDAFTTAYNNYMSGRTSTQGAYGGIGDMAHNFVLCPGVMITVNYDSYFSNSNTTPTSVTTRIMNFGLDYTQTGGSMNYIALQEYGWNGTQWELNNSNGRTVHSTTESLFDGVEVRFENGVSGVSFQTPNVYKFGLADGLLKDNATRATYKATTYYSRKTTENVTDLDSSVVPSARAGSTGIVGIDLANCSSNAYLNLDNEVIFPGQNLRQYAVGDKPLVGDFVISIDVTNLNANDVKNAACIGITRQDWINGGLMQFGFICNAGILFWYDNGSTSSITTITAGTTTSLEIRRTGTVITLWRNGSNVRTMSNAAIRSGEVCLDVIRHVWEHTTATNLPSTGTRVPKVTITDNGTAIYVEMGNPITDTGRFTSRFYGVDYITPNTSTVTLDGTVVTPKTDGTAPLAGEVSIDVARGVMYFNSADVGKPITANYLVISS